MANTKMANRWGANLCFYKYDPLGYYDDSTLLYKVDFANEVAHDITSGTTWATGGQAHANMIGFKDSTNGTLTITTQITTDTLRAIAAGMDISNYKEGDPINYMNDEIAIIPQTYIITAETIYQDTNGKAHKRIMKYMKATVSPATSESFAGDGDPQELEIEFELGTNEDLRVHSSQTDPDENADTGSPDEKPIDVSTSDELISDIKAGETLVLAQGLSVSAEDLNTALEELDGEVTIDLGGNTLNLTGAKSLWIDKGATVTIKGSGDSEITSDITRATVKVMTVSEGGTLNLEGVKYDGAGEIVGVEADATVNITDCELTTSGPYGVAIDNPLTSDDAKATVNIINSKITCEADDSCALYTILDSDITVKNSTLSAHRQGAFIKFGKATFEDSTISVDLTYEDTSGYCENADNWFKGAGNEVSCGALVCGSNATTSDYKFDTNVALTNTLLTCTTGDEPESEHCFALYATGNLATKADGNLSQTSVTADEWTVCNAVGKIYAAGNENYADAAFVTTPEGATVTINF